MDKFGVPHNCSDKRAFLHTRLKNESQVTAAFCRLAAWNRHFRRCRRVREPSRMLWSLMGRLLGNSDYYTDLLNLSSLSNIKTQT